MIESDDSLIESVFGGAKASVLDALCREEKSMDELSELLRINKNAVKEHMDYLERRGYVKSFFRHSARGRPRKFFELTERGYELFPKKYGMFASLMVEALEEELGPEKVNDLLDKVAVKILRNSTGDLEGGAEIGREDKLKRLDSFVTTLNRLGYYARLEVSDNVARIIRNNCVFYEVAKHHSGKICGILESDIIKKSTNSEFSIVEKFTEGSKKCVVELQL